MCFKRALINMFRTIAISFYSLKNMRILAVIPFIALNLVLTAINITGYMRYGNGYQLEEDIRKYAIIFMPLFSNWWPIFAMREYIESDGNELLFIQSNKIKYIDFLTLFLIYLVDISIFLAVYILVYPQLKLVSIWILIICSFIFSITYFLVFFTKSITVTLMCTLLYHIINIGRAWREPVPLIYGSAQGYAFIPEFVHVYFPMLIIGALATAGGIILNYRFIKYN